MNSFNFLSSPIADALGWTLLHAVWQGFALVLPAAVALHLLRSRSSALRYRIGTLTLLSQLLASAATFAWCYAPITTIHSAKSMSMAVHTLPVRWQSVAQTVPWHQQLQLFLANHLGQFVLMYLIGVVLFGLRLAGGWLYLQRLTQTATQPAASICLQLANRIRSTMAIKTIVQVRESARIAVPMVVGVLKPVLLLPIGLVTNLTTREIEAVLAHELAHVKRYDYAVNLLQSVVEVLYFFHPALWWLSARVREEREHCCDDLAVQACGGDGRILARALAHVEELRLTPVQSTPALAMALATNRQQLLRRVQRMLGVPTRPFVSNGSLAGLTLATILLMSVSVYAVQKQNQPKPTKSPSSSTRRHKAGNGSEFTMIDNKKVDLIIWKGQKLPASRIARLQKQFDQVMSGQLSLDAVKQPDRDILLTIIETNQGHQEGMEALAEGLSHIDYSNIVASALKNVPLSPDGTVEGLAKVNYDSIVKNAFDSYSKAQVMLDSLPELNSGTSHFQDVLRSQDSLAAQRESNQEKLALLEAQAQSQHFAVEAVERKIERIERQRSVLEQKRFFETSAQKQAIFKSGTARTDSARATLMKQIEAGEQTIQTTESAIEKLNQQLINMQADMERAQKPLRETEKQIRQLNYSGQLSYSSYAERGQTHLARLPRPMPAPRPAIAPNVVHPAIPATPALAPTPPLTRTPRGVAAPAPPIPPGVKVRKIVFPKPAPAPFAPALEPVPAAPAARVRGRVPVPSRTAPKPASAPTPKQP